MMKMSAGLMGRGREGRNVPSCVFVERERWCVREDGGGDAMRVQRLRGLRDERGYRPR